MIQDPIFPLLIIIIFTLNITLVLKISCTRRSGPPTLHIPFIPVANWPNRLLNLLNIFSSLGGRINRGGEYRGNTTVSRL